MSNNTNAEVSNVVENVPISTCDELEDLRSSYRQGTITGEEYDRMMGLFKEIEQEEQYERMMEEEVAREETKEVVKIVPEVEAPLEDDKMLF